MLCLALCPQDLSIGVKRRFAQDHCSVRAPKDHHIHLIAGLCIFHKAQRERHTHGVTIRPRGDATDPLAILEYGFAPALLRKSLQGFIL